MAATVGLVLAAVSIGEPLIKAICGLRRAYCATNNASDALNRLEHTGNTIHLYLKKVDDGLRRNPSECTEDFTQWFEDEKKVLKHSVSEIDEFTEKFQQRLYTSTVLGAITYVMDEREILKIENRLASHINILDCMKRICQQYARRRIKLRCILTCFQGISRV
jgi:hypothetical protein